MQDFEFNIRDIYRIFLRRKWLLILASVVCGTVTYLTTTSPKPVYEAESLVKISRVAANMQALMIEAMSWYQGDNIETQSRIITSRKVKARVAMRLAKKYSEFADIRSLLWDEEEGDYDALEEKVRNNTKLRMLVDGLSVATEKQGVSDIVGISAIAFSQELAVDMANYLAEEYVKYNMAERNSQIRKAVQFIQVTLGETEQELSEVEKKLEGFKRDNTTILSLNVGDQGNIQEQIEGLGRQIGNFQEAIEQLEPITNIEEYLTFSPPLSDIQDSFIDRLEQQLWRLTDQINELKTRQRAVQSFRTDQFREVRQNVLQIEELENRGKETIGTLLRRYRAIHDELFERRRSLVQRQIQFQAVPEVIRQLESLQRDVALKTDTLNLFQRRLQDAKIQRASEIKEVTVVELATTAATLFGPSRRTKVLAALMIGAMLGGVFIIILESLDTSIGTIEDVERYLAIPVLGVVPHLDAKMVKEKLPVDVIWSDDPSEDISGLATLFTHFVPQEPISEAFRTIRAHLEILFKRHSWKTLMVTSSVVQEGKTSTACNLAVVFAQSGYRTLLIDADLRRSNVHKVFGLSRTPGLSEILLGVSDWKSTTQSMDDIILGKFGSKNSQITPGLEHLFLLTSGRSVDNPAELLHFEKFSEILSEIRNHYDVIIVDITPVLPVAEALQIASGIDAILLAYQIGRVGRDVTKRTKDRLEAVGGNIVGLVMNDIQAEMYYAHDQEYYNDYKDIAIPIKSSWGPLSRLKERLSKFITPWVS